MSVVNETGTFDTSTGIFRNETTQEAFLFDFVSNAGLEMIYNNREVDVTLKVKLTKDYKNAIMLFYGKLYGSKNIIWESRKNGVIF